MWRSQPGELLQPSPNSSSPRDLGEDKFTQCDVLGTRHLGVIWPLMSLPALRSGHFGVPAVSCRRPPRQVAKVNVPTWPSPVGHCLQLRCGMPRSSLQTQGETRLLPPANRWRMRWNMGLHLDYIYECTIYT